VLLGPAWLLFGGNVLLESSVALALTLVPALATLFWAQRVSRGSPETLLGIRMAIVLGIGAWLYFGYPATFGNGLLGWIIVFYLVLLAVEVTLLLRPTTSLAGNETKASA
jgi:hypothetical protein